MGGNRDTILIVDDQELNRVILRSVFEQHYNLLEAENGEQAMMYVEEFHDSFAAMLLDIVMPIMDGYQVMTELGNRGFLNEFPVVIITAENSADNEMQAFDLGASDIIAKPFEPHVIRRRVQNIIDLNLQRQNQEATIEEQATKIRESNAVMVDALTSIIEYRSMETGQHIKRIRLFTQALLENVARSYPEYLLDEHKIGVITSASSMHDIGKVAIPDSILNKPGHLTDAEYEVMKTHTTMGCQMLKRMDRMSDREYLQYAYNICRHHHERWNGEGYPDGLRGDSIPICAQVVSIADCYDALTNDRVYKKAIPPDQAFNMILNGECGSFSPRLLESLKNVQTTFTRLTEDYADDNDADGAAVLLQPQSPTYKPMPTDTLQMGQLKYFTLLRYANSTVMEIDLASGLYHLVYLSNDDFEALRDGNSLKESIESFAEKAIHPDDQAALIAMIGDELDAFFNEGLSRRDRRYRVLDKESDTYRWCTATLMRIDTDSPLQRRALLIWHESEHVDDIVSDMFIRDDFKTRMFNNVIDAALVCRSDRYFTLMDIGDRLKNLLGYTAEDIHELFSDHYISLIHPADRDEVIQQLRDQSRQGSLVELEYRLIAKDGNPVWVLDKSQIVADESGDEYINFALIDATPIKRTKDELRQLMERYQLVIEQTNDVVFEWDSERDLLSYSSNCNRKFGFVPITDHASERLFQASHVHPDDMAALQQFIDSVRKGTSTHDLDLRVADANGRYRWHKIRAASQLDDANAVLRVVGVISDIDEDKRASQELQEKADRDSLTTLYNRQAATQRIKEYLDRRKLDDEAAMLIVDIDDFKLVNDSYGHMFGDVVLKEITSKLQTMFRSNDIISRIGGDEFLIFMSNVRNREIVETRANTLVETFAGMKLENIPDYQVTCSVGIALCPSDGENYEALFRHADLALYSAKSIGKNHYLMFDSDTMERPLGVPQAPMPAMRTDIDSEKRGISSVRDLMNQTFQMLYESTDLDKTIDAILALVGEQFSVSRVYIFEDSEDGSYCNCTFEWCKEGIEAQKNVLQNILYKPAGEDFRDSFNEEGVFYCTDVAMLPLWQQNPFKSQGIKSLLQCAIYDSGTFKGHIGFDDCLVHRVWTKGQIDALKTVSQYISTFLFAKRHADKNRELTTNLEGLLDNEDARVMVVEPETYRVLYCNRRLIHSAKKIRTGALCYSAIYGKNVLCPDCPIPLSTDSLGKEPSEQRPSKPNTPGETTVERIDWCGRAAYLLTLPDQPSEA